MRTSPGHEQSRVLAWREAGQPRATSRHHQGDANATWEQRPGTACKAERFQVSNPRRARQTSSAVRSAPGHAPVRTNDAGPCGAAQQGELARCVARQQPRGLATCSASCGAVRHRSTVWDRVDDARASLSTGHVTLGGMRPIEVALTGLGARLVGPGRSGASPMVGSTASAQPLPQSRMPAVDGRRAGRWQ
jgi:hypothetical protein